MDDPDHHTTMIIRRLVEARIDRGRGNSADAEEPAAAITVDRQGLLDQEMLLHHLINFLHQPHPELDMRRPVELMPRHLVEELDAGYRTLTEQWLDAFELPDK